MVAFARWIRASDRQSPLNTENLSIVLYILPPQTPYPYSTSTSPPSPSISPPIVPIPTPTKTSHQPLHIINHKRRYNTNSISQRSPPPQKPSHLHRTTTYTNKATHSPQEPFASSRSLPLRWRRAPLCWGALGVLRVCVSWLLDCYFWGGEWTYGLRTLLLWVVRGLDSGGDVVF